MVSGEGEASDLVYPLLGITESWYLRYRIKNNYIQNSNNKIEIYRLNIKYIY